jgi:hypothetical protein
MPDAPTALKFEVHVVRDFRVFSYQQTARLEVWMVS